MCEYGTPPPRTVIGDPSQECRQRRNLQYSCASALPSVCRMQDHAVGHSAIADEVPQGDEELARQCDDHLFARAGRGLGTRPKPLCQGALFLEIKEAPREL